MEDLYKLLLALVLGGAIGFEREYRGKAAGFRTIILITMGSTLFSILSQRIVEGCDVDRISANLVVGIGFLGAGVIFKEDNRILGLTTASTIWISAALGLSIGSGYWELSLIVAGLILIVLIFLPKFEKLFDIANQSRMYRIVCAYDNQTLAKYEKLFRSYKLKSYSLKQSVKHDTITGSWNVVGHKRNHERIINILIADKDILQFDY